MSHPSRHSRCYAWRSFDRRQGRLIELQLRTGKPTCCPLCDSLLEARPTTRFARWLVLGSRGHDLDCRDCRRFWCVVRHSPRAIRLIRMRRFIAAVRATGEQNRGRGTAPREPLQPAIA